MKARPTLGFTMLEMVLVLMIAFLLLGIAFPRLLESSHRVAVRNARSQVTSAVSVARSTSTRYGRVSYLFLDVALNQLVVRADTSQDGNQPPAALHQVDLWGDLGIDLEASYPVICFDPRGFSMPNGLCPGASVTVRMLRGGSQDSVMVSTTGRASE